MTPLQSAKELLDDAIRRQRLTIDAAVPAARAALDDVHEDEPVGLAEITNRLGVKRQTVDNWRQRGVLPAPRWMVAGRPVWSWQLDIEPWARETGRLDRIGRKP